MISNSKQTGISLVEILVALVISLFLLGGIIQVYLGSKTTYKFSNALSEVQENGRFALETMTRDIRQAGHWGCIKFDPNDTSNIVNKVDKASVGASHNTDLHDFINGKAIEGENDPGNGSDTITIRGSKPGQANVISPFSETGPVSVTSSNNISAEDIVLIMRCGENDRDTDADIVHVTGIGTDGNGNPNFSVNNTVILSQAYNNDAAVIRLQTVTYSIKNGVNTQPALFRSEFGDDQELIEGVQEMQILYGIDTDIDGFANEYVTSDEADTAGNFETVVSARIMLLVASSDALVNEVPQKYSFNSVDNITAADGRFYQVFNTTIALRNRAGK
jgi:type IV pilus assembly protein PilW